MSDPSPQGLVSGEGENAPLFSAKVFFSGLSFLLFGIMGLVLSTTVFPLLYLLPIKAQQRLRKQGEAALAQGGQLIIANHPSLLDVVYLIASVKNANCLIKRSLFFNPFTAGVVRAAGYIRNDSPTLLEQSTASLSAGDSLIVFPEGTRSDPREPLHFLRGTANIAIAAKCDIRPIVIRVTPARLMKHQAWYEMSTETLDVTIEVCPTISLAPYIKPGSRRSRMSRQLTADLESFYRNH